MMTRRLTVQVLMHHCCGARCLAFFQAVEMSLFFCHLQQVFCVCVSGFSSLSVYNLFSWSFEFPLSLISICIFWAICLLICRVCLIWLCCSTSVKTSLCSIYKMSVVCSSCITKDTSVSSSRVAFFPLVWTLLLLLPVHKWPGTILVVASQIHKPYMQIHTHTPSVCHLNEPLNQQRERNSQRKH